MLVGLLTLLGLLAVTGVLVGLGYALAHDRLAVDRARLAQQRQALDAEWTALENTRRVRAVFLSARRATQDEARRSSRDDG